MQLLSSAAAAASCCPPGRPTRALPSRHLTASPLRPAPCRSTGQPAEAAAKSTLDSQLELLKQDVREMMEKVNTGGPILAGEQSDQEETYTAPTLRCDENGCVIVEDWSDGSAGPLPKMLSGEGFKLGMGETSVDSTQFTAVVGGSDWSVGLTAVELNDFVLALKAIRRTINDMAAQHAANARNTKPLQVRWDTSCVHMEATCTSTPPSSELFDLLFRINGGRTATGTWPSAVVQRVCAALDATDL